MKVNEMYVAPALEVINVAVEAGFEGSNTVVVTPPETGDDL